MQYLSGPANTNSLFENRSQPLPKLRGKVRGTLQSVTSLIMQLQFLDKVVARQVALTASGLIFRPGLALI